MKKTSIIWFFLGVFEMFIIPIVTSFYDDITINRGVAIAIVAVVVLFYFLGCFVIKKQHEEKIKALVMHKVETIVRNYSVLSDPNYSGHNLCKIHGHYCCMYDLINSAFYNESLNHLVISDDTLENYGLISVKGFNILEQSFFDDHPDGEIWVISSELETEIKSDTDEQHHSNTPTRMTIQTLEDNIRLGKKYIQFTSFGPNGKDGIAFRSRKKKYWSVIPDRSEKEKAKTLPIIRIDSDFKKINKIRTQFDDPDWGYLIQLTSIVIFIDDIKGTYEGYYYLRPENAKKAYDYERKAVFYKMPTECMLAGISKELFDRRKEYFENLEATK